jgi:TRAP-type C4-dicarboxylate transport system permease small subunit
VSRRSGPPDDRRARRRQKPEEEEARDPTPDALRGSPSRSLMRWLDRAVLALGFLLSWGFAAIALMMVWEVGARYGFNRPTIWAHEIAGLLAGAAFIAGGAYCMVEGSHMRVSLLLDRMPPRLRWAAEALSLVVGTVFLLGLTVSMWGIAQRSFFRFDAAGTWRPERSGTSWNTPAPAILKLMLLIGAALFLLVVLRRAVALVRGRD